MTILYYELEVIIRSISFFVISNSNITRIEEAGLELCMQLPGIAFYGVYKFIFYCVLPYGIIVVVVFTIITSIIWKKGIRYYNSASS
ncbi:hypothetical protein [[Clostridium] fimetarium]|uniref:ABC-2 type transport system permease protein n=1 Tax=[Clostridium] fimetarium TaxID=99656 RepID=A0A1I0P825_9FIRM|nr:hypothetical protein [[Clostridium] fimetarium]SEW10194.1 ABC-2 type transport system permease protein [[Clostridium] fimetarium]